LNGYNFQILNKLSRATPASRDGPHNQRRLRAVQTGR